MTVHIMEMLGLTPPRWAPVLVSGVALFGVVEPAWRLFGTAREAIPRFSQSATSDLFRNPAIARAGWAADRAEATI